MRVRCDECRGTGLVPEKFHGGHLWKRFWIALRNGIVQSECERCMGNGHIDYPNVVKFPTSYQAIQALANRKPHAPEIIEIARRTGR